MQLRKSGVLRSAIAALRPSQTLVQANGFCLTLLQLDEDDIEEADEEDDLIESYAVRFRKR